MINSSSPHSCLEGVKIVHLSYMLLLRKIFLLSFLPLYVISFTGIRLHVHYCHNEIKSISLTKIPSCCSEEGCLSAKKGKKCAGCDEEWVVIQPLEADQLPVVNSDNKSPFLSFPIASLLFMVPKTEREEASTFFSEVPPERKTYLRFQQLIYYG